MKMRRVGVLGVLLVLVSLTLLSSTGVSLANAQVTGLRAAINAQLFDSEISLWEPYIFEKITSYQIPELSGENSEGPLNIHWTVSNAVISNPVVGGLAVAFYPNDTNLLVVAGSDMGITVNADWSYYFWTGWKNSDHGTVTLTFSGIAFVVEATVVVTNGAPQVTLQYSAIDTGDCSINLSGGASWLYDLFKSVIVSEIQNGVKDAFNNDIPEEIAKVNSLIAEKPLYYLDSQFNIGLNYELTEQPAVTVSNVLTTSILGAFYAGNEGPSVLPPIAPSVTIPYVISGQDVQVIVSDFVLNSLGWALWTEGWLNYTITAADLPTADQKYMNTSEYKLFISKLYSKFPNDAIQFHLEPPTYPEFTIDGTNGIKFYYDTPVAWMVVEPNGTLTEAFLLGVSVGADVTVSFNSTTNTIGGSLQNLQVNISLISSNIGEFGLGLVETVLNVALKSTIIPKINSLLQKGFPIPSLPDGIVLQNPSIDIADGYFGVSLDAVVNPPSTGKVRIH